MTRPARIADLSRASEGLRGRTFRPRRAAGETTLAALGLLAGLGAGVSCWRPADGHCGNLDGDLTCSERGGGRYCDACQADTDGCTDVMPSEGCYFAGAAGTSTSGVETGSEVSTSPMSVDSSTGSSSATTGPVGCGSDEDCPDLAMPFCAPSGSCVACDGAPDPHAACAGLDPAQPYCDQGVCMACSATTQEGCPAETPVCSDGVCVQCTHELQQACSATSMGCDDATNTCIPCTEHAQCAGGAACNLFTSECLPASVVVHVGKGQPFTTLEQALSSVEMEPAATIVVHEGTYLETLSIPTDRVVAFLADASAEVVWTAVANPQLNVTAGTVLLDGIDLVGGPGTGWVLLVDQARAWVDRARIAPPALGLRVNGPLADLRLRNCMLGTVDQPGVRVINGASTQILYSTLVRTGTSAGAAMECPSPGPVELRNSIVIAAGGFGGSELDCPEAVELGNAREAQVGELDGMWFVDLANDDLHLSELGAATFADFAAWQSGDPPVDIDGDLRPGMDGAPDFPGADVP